MAMTQNEEDDVRIQDPVDDYATNEQNPLNQFYEMYGTGLGLEQTPGSKSSQGQIDPANALSNPNQQT